MIASAVATLGIEDSQMSTTELPTEDEIYEWTQRSIKEGICGIVGCFNNPTTQCKKCTNYYRSEHFPPHLDLLPDGNSDLEYNKTIPNPSNDGLELYMEDEPEDSD
jgi:hypothetical protein